MARPTAELDDADYQALARFRFALRVFLRFSEDAARAAGLTPNQHQLLLAVRGFPTGAPTIGEVTMSPGEPARLLPPWIHTRTGRLPLSDEVPTSRVRQSSRPDRKSPRFQPWSFCTQAAAGCR